MTPKKRKAKACTGKAKYKTMEEARNSMIGMIRSKSRKGDPVVSEMRTYRCGFCGCFHFGKTREIRWGDL